MTGPRGGPVARPDSPSAPLGRHNLTVRLGMPVRVVIDTSTFFAGSYRAPLFASAREGDLAVYWSSAITREIIKVAYREAVLAVLRSSSSNQDPRVDGQIMRQRLDEVAKRVDLQIGACERVFTMSSNLDAVDEALLAIVADAADRPVLRAALAEGISYILSLDQRHFAHGTVYHGVECWHPDTFITLFYQQNPDAYARAIRSVRDLPEAISLRLLP